MEGTLISTIVTRKFKTSRLDGCNAMFNSFMDQFQMAQVANIQVLGFWTIIRMVQMWGKYEPIEYLDLSETIGFRS